MVYIELNNPQKTSAKKPLHPTEVTERYVIIGVLTCIEIDYSLKLYLFTSNAELVHKISERIIGMKN